MRVQVDEAGRDDEPGGVDDALGAAQPGADGGDAAVDDRDVADRVHPRRGVHHPAAADDHAAHVVTPAPPLDWNRARFLQRQPPPPKLTQHAFGVDKPWGDRSADNHLSKNVENNPMQSSRRPPASEGRLDTSGKSAVLFQYSEIISAPSIRRAKGEPERNEKPTTASADADPPQRVLRRIGPDPALTGWSYPDPFPVAPTSVTAGPSRGTSIQHQQGSRADERAGTSRSHRGRQGWSIVTAGLRAADDRRRPDGADGRHDAEPIRGGDGCGRNPLQADQGRRRRRAEAAVLAGGDPAQSAFRRRHQGSGRLPDLLRTTGGMGHRWQSGSGTGCRDSQQGE